MGKCAAVAWLTILVLVPTIALGQDDTRLREQATEAVQVYMAIHHCLKYGGKAFFESTPDGVRFDCFFEKTGPAPELPPRDEGGEPEFEVEELRG